MQKISVVIPCYNSKDTLPTVIEELVTVFLEHNEKSYEIILVNDCSKDETWKTIEKLCIQHPELQGINLGKNFGQHAAIMAGLNYVEGDIVVCMDDDGQTPGNEIYVLIEELNNDTDAVYAKYDNKQHNGFRNLGSKLNDLMASYLLNKPKELYVSSYFAIKKYVVQNMINYNNPYPYVIGLVLQSTNKIKNVNINHRERTVGESGYSFHKLISLWVNGFTSFSVKPLRIATALGFMFSIVGFLYAVYIIVRKIMVPTIPMGWSSLTSAIMLTNGVVLIVLGLIGEYVGRVFISLNNIPQFVIKEHIKKDKTNESQE